MNIQNVLRRTAALLCAGSIFSASMTAVPSSAHAALSLAPGRTAATIPGTFFGIHIHRAASTTSWPEAPPFKTWRLWDAFTQWRQLEPQKGLWDFKTLDSYVAKAETSGVEILLPLGLSPQWASARPAEKSMYGLGHAAEPARIQDWQDYVRTVVTRYKGRIRYYEIWNEPNLKTFFSGTTATMITLTKEAATIIKEIDPQAKLVSPSPTGTTGVAWLNRFLSKGGAPYVDIIGYHFYVTPGVPEKMEPIIQRVKKVRAKNGLQNLPIWNTESGWTFPNSLSLSEESLGAYVARSFLINWTQGVDRFYWYSWDSTQNGLVNTGGLIQTVAAQSYVNIVEWLKDARITDFRRTSKGIYIATIERAGGYEARIAWKKSGTTKLKLPEAWDARRVRTLAGTTDYVKGLASYPVGTSPVIFENVD